jgi:hypothetical protein
LGTSAKWPNKRPLDDVPELRDGAGRAVACAGGRATGLREGVVLFDAGGAVLAASERARALLGDALERLELVRDDGTALDRGGHPAAVAIAGAAAVADAILGVRRADGASTGCSSRPSRSGAPDGRLRPPPRCRSPTSPSAARSRSSTAPSAA